MTPEIQPFHAMTVGAEAFRLEASGQPIIHMEYGQPTVKPPHAVAEAAEKMLRDGVKGYWESEPLKEAISKTYADLYGVDIATSRIVLTCGASPALALALMAAFKPGDRIAMARPGYVAHRNCVVGLHMIPEEVPCGAGTGYQLTAEVIERLGPAPQGLIIASPANPTGSVISNDEMREIAAVCERKNIRIISDEIYARLSYVGPVASMTEFSANACIINSFSKFYAMPGWRLGWAVLPDDLAVRGHAYMSNFFLTPPSLSQAAGLVAMAGEEELGRHVEMYERNRAQLLEALPALGLSDIAPPDGAFYLYGRVDHLTDDSRDLCMQLLADTGVATASGVDFDPVDGKHFMRFSFAVDESALAEALERITPWFAQHQAR